MFAQTKWRFGIVERRGMRPRWRAGRALSGAGLAAVLAAGLANASPVFAEVVVSHSAKSGELRGGRLLLRGVSGRASYVTDAGRSGTTSVRWMHRRVFLPGKSAVGMLHIAGWRGGQEPTFKLSKPRYSASRRTVSYKAKPLPGTRVSSRAAGAAALQVPRRFGAASLSILPHPTLAPGDNGGRDCTVDIDLAGNLLSGVGLVSASKWDTDTWDSYPSGAINYPPEGSAQAIVTSYGGLWRGCGWSTVWRTAPDGYSGNITISVSWQWNGGISTSCTVADPNPHGVYCYRDDEDVIGWVISN